MSYIDFLGRAIDLVKRAIEADNSTEYEKAYGLYKQSLEVFMIALKWEKNEQSKEMIRTKIKEYMSRAEKLKVHLTENEEDNDKRRPTAVGSNGKASRAKGK